MRRDALEHILRAAGSLTNESQLLVLGSQSILGSYPHVPDELGISVEADVFPLRAPGKTDLISGSIGELSLFHSMFGYYAHGLPPSACALPTDWEKRLVLLKNENTSGVSGYCLDPADLACAKLAAAREKDLAYTTALLFHQLANIDTVKERIAHLPESHSRTAALRSLALVQRSLASYTPPSIPPDSA